MLGEETKVEAQSKKVIRRDTINSYLTRNFSRKNGEI